MSSCEPGERIIVGGNVGPMELKEKPRKSLKVVNSKNIDSSDKKRVTFVFSHCCHRVQCYVVCHYRNFVCHFVVLQTIYFHITSFLSGSGSVVKISQRMSFK